MQIRDLLPTDQSLIEQAFGHADAPPDAVSGAEAVWGLVAEDDESTLGVLWVRHTTPEAPGDAFLSTEIPELSVHLFSDDEVADELLSAAIAESRRRGLAGLSTAVEFGGPLAYAFGRHGFRTVGINDGADLMLLTLGDAG